MATITHKGRQEVATYFKRELHQVKEHAPQLWNKSISRVIQLWPVALEHQDSETYFTLAQMILETRESFPEALQFLKERRLLGNVSKPYRILMLLRRYQDRSSSYALLLEKHPEEIVEFLDIIIPKKIEPKTNDIGEIDTHGRFNEVLDLLQKNRPELANGHRFQRLRGIFG
ncbi:hypothetical protein ACQZV8_18530 [Magnetococcales bacterium HHB-1]